MLVLYVCAWFGEIHPAYSFVFPRLSFQSVEFLLQSWRSDRSSAKRSFCSLFIPLVSILVKRSASYFT